MKTVCRLSLFLSAFLLSNLLYSSNSIAAPTPMVLSLKDAIYLGLRDNPNVQNEEIQRIVDKINLRVAQWGYEPHYSLTGAINYTNAVSNGSGSEGDTANITPGISLLTPIGTQVTAQLQNNFNHTAGSSRTYNPNLSLGIVQPLMQGFGPNIALAPLHLAENQELLNRLNFKNIAITTITNIISQYAAVAQAQNSIKMQELSLKNVIDTLNYEKAFLKTGRIAESELVQFKASVASQQLSLQQLQVSLSQQIRQLLVSLGIDPTIPLTVSNEIVFPNEHVCVLEECIRLGLENNIPYQQALINVKQSKINLDVAIDNQRPTLNLNVTRTQGGGAGGGPNSGFSSLTNGANMNTGVGLSLSVPVDNLSLQGQLESAKIALRQQETLLEAQKRQVIIDVTNAYNVVVNQKNQLTQAKQAVQLAQQTLNIANAKLKWGRVSAFEVSTLQTNLITQQLTEVNTISAYYTNLALLDQIIGTSLHRWNVYLKY